MSVFTFSTKSTKPADEEVVLKVKQHCDRNNLNFSAVVVALLREHAKELTDGKS